MTPDNVTAMFENSFRRSVMDDEELRQPWAGRVSRLVPVLVVPTHIDRVTLWLARLDKVMREPIVLRRCGCTAFVCRIRSFSP
jgi:hypothetical protein